MRTIWPDGVSRVVFSVPGGSPQAMVETYRLSALGCGIAFRMWPTRRSMREGERGGASFAAAGGFAGLPCFMSFLSRLGWVDDDEPGGGTEDDGFVEVS